MEEILKQRLVGTSVLVVLAVIFLPFLFDGSGMVKPTVPLSLDLPKASVENTVTITLKPQRVKSSGVVVKSKLNSKAEVKKLISRAATKKNGDKTQWIIQLGSFSQRGNAYALRDKLIYRGYKSFIDTTGQGSTLVYRVRVGPESSRESVEVIHIKLQNSEKHKGLVIAYP